MSAEGLRRTQKAATRQRVLAAARQLFATQGYQGATVRQIALLAGVPADQVRMGMRVRAVWRPREEWDQSMANIRWFEPVSAES